LSVLLFPVSDAGGAGGILFEGPSFYLGGITILLALFSVVKKTDISSRSIFVLAVFGFLLSFGSIEILDRLQYAMPLFGKFGSPEQGFFIGQFFMVILAASGLQYLISHFSDDKVRAYIPGVFITFTIMAMLGSKVFQLDWTPAFYVVLIISTFISMSSYVFSHKKIISTISLALLVLVQVIDSYGLAVTNLPENDIQRYQNSRWMEKTAGEIQKTNSRYVFTSIRGLEDEELLYHAGMALDIDGIDGWITVPPRRYAEFIALADKRSASFKDGKLHQLGLNAELKDGKFIDADSMPILDLLSLRYVINRELPLKFSTPYFLGTVPSNFHKRTQVNGAHVEMEDAVVRLERQPFHEKIIAGPNEQYRYKLYIQKGDRLRFKTALSKNMAGEEKVFKIKVLHDNEEDVIFEAGTSGQVHDIDLERYAGKTIEMLLITKGPPERNDLVYIWEYIAIVNDGKPFKLWSVPEDDILIYENLESLPRAFIVHDYEVVDKDEKMLERLKSASRYEFSQKVFLERKPQHLQKPDKVVSGHNNKVELMDKKPGAEIYRVRTDKRGILFVSDQYYPGFKAFVRDVEKPILQANYCFRSVEVPAGTSIVKFLYVPASFRIGLFATVSSIMFMLFALIIIIQTNKNKL
jgi:hypothetical protein